MLIVTGFTPTYADHFERLRASCEHFGYELWSRAYVDRGSWAENCAAKPSIILEARRERPGAPLLWLDADAEIRKPLGLIVTNSDADFSVYRRNGTMPFASGTVWFAANEWATGMLEAWAAVCRDDPTVWDQVHLHNVWQEEPVRTFWLPHSYCCKFDERAADDAHIMHYQASRKTKRAKVR